MAVDDAVVIERAARIGVTLYQQGVPALAGTPLRSVTGLDFGPREHQAAERMIDDLIAGRRPLLRDARILIAAAVMAWVREPSAGPRILRAARVAVGKLDIRVPRAAVARTAQPDDADLLREAILLDALLTPPRRSLLRR
jgi:hypothetical protein